MVKVKVNVNLMTRLWNAWEVQTLVLSSLAFQIILTIFGGRRRYYSGNVIRAIVWTSYLMSSWVTIVALGKLTDINVVPVTYKHAHDSTVTKIGTINALRALWAPLLLVHIGGPDTITAYSVEDNKFAWRQSLELVNQIIVVTLVLYKSWTNSWLSILTFPLFLAGIIKSGERVWALYSSISDKSVRALLTDIRKAIPEEPASFRRDSGLRLLVTAYRRFDQLKPHLENWHGHPLSFKLPSTSVLFDRAEDVFKMAEFELSFMYDVLYTKALINYSWISFCRRLLCFLCLASALAGCSILFRNADLKFLDYLAVLQSRNKSNKKLDIVITYVLLVGAIVLEIYAISQLVRSDWAILHMMRQRRNSFLEKFLRIVTPKNPSATRRWSHSMGQLNLISYCFHQEPSKLYRMISRILKVTNGYGDRFDIFGVTTWVQIDKDLKKLIVEQMKAVRGQRGWRPYTNSGEWALERNKCLTEFEWSIQKEYHFSGAQANKQTQFSKAIIRWHIATDACYFHSESDSCQQEIDYKMTSKILSDYMMYLLATKPHMLSCSAGSILFQGACDKVKAFLGEKQSTTTSSNQSATFCGNLPYLEIRDYEIRDENVLIKNWKVLSEAKKLAKQLLEKKEEKWRIISSVWVEMLCYAASNCPWNLHAMRLARGGELLTHVWLLLDHETDKFNLGFSAIF